MRVSSGLAATVALVNSYRPLDSHWLLCVEAWLRPPPACARAGSAAVALRPRRPQCGVSVAAGGTVAQFTCCGGIVSRVATFPSKFITGTAPASPKCEGMPVFYHTSQYLFNISASV